MVADASNGSAAPGAVQGVTTPRQHPSRHEPPQKAQERRAAESSRPVNPADVESAVRRLDLLLEKDAGNGPRQGTPPRGFYLNIVV